MKLKDLELLEIQNHAKKLHKQMFTSRSHEQSISMIEDLLKSVYKKVKCSCSLPDQSVG